MHFMNGWLGPVNTGSSVIFHLLTFGGIYFSTFCIFGLGMSKRRAGKWETRKAFRDKEMAKEEGQRRGGYQWEKSLV